MKRIFIIALSLLVISTTVSFVYGHPKPQQQPATSDQPEEYNEWKAAWKNLKDAFRNVGNWFVRQYRTVQNWFSGTRQELEKKVQDMISFLGTVKQNFNTLVAGAGDQLNHALQNVNNFYTETVQFQQKLRADVATNFEQLEQEWRSKVQNMYNSGLDKIVEAAEKAKMDVRPGTNATVAK